MVHFPFYLAAALAVASTFMVIVTLNAVHALLYLVLSLLAVAGVFFTLGAPFAGVLEVIVYAGAIMVLFVFVVMMLNLGQAQTDQERLWLQPRTWAGPALIALLLLVPVGQVILGGPLHPAGEVEVGARAVGIALYGPYLLAVELASMLLTAALVAAYHLGKQE